MSLADLLTMFSARIIGTYTPEQYADCVREARANRHRWGMGSGERYHDFKFNR